MARGLKFRTYEVEGLYYPCSENKGADQLRSYREADLRLCYDMQKAGFLMTRLNFFLRRTDRSIQNHQMSDVIRKPAFANMQISWAVTARLNNTFVLVHLNSAIPLLS